MVMSVVLAGVAVVHFALPPSSLNKAINSVCQRSKCEVVYLCGDVAPLRSPALYGEHTPAHALQTLLQSTPLTLIQVRPQVFAVVPRTVAGMQSPVETTGQPKVRGFPPTALPTALANSEWPHAKTLKRSLRRNLASAHQEIGSPRFDTDVRESFAEERDIKDRRGRQAATHDREGYLQQQCVCARSVHGLSLGPWCQDAEGIHSDSNRCPASDEVPGSTVEWR